MSAQKAIAPSIGVAPALVRRDLIPGQAQTVTITLTNYGADPIPLSVEKNTIAGVSDDGTPEFTTVAGPRSAGDWVTLGQNDLILSGHSSQDVTLTITAPKGTAPGGYNTAVQFQTKLPSFYFDLDANARILPALSVSLLLTIGTDQAPTISDLRVQAIDTPSVVLSAPVPVVTEVTNPTNFYIFTDSNLSVTSTFGGKQLVTNLKNSVIFPNSTRKFVTAYTGGLLPGVYHATLQLAGGQKTLVASARFVAVPWLFIVVILLIAFMLVGLGARRRLKRAYQALLGREPISGRHKPVIR